LPLLSRYVWSTWTPPSSPTTPPIGVAIPKRNSMASKTLVRDRLGRSAALQRTHQPLINGHARKKLCTGQGNAPVLIGSWNGAKERTILAILDPIGALAEANQEEALETLLDQVATKSAALQLQLAGFATQSRIGPVVTAGQTDSDDVPLSPDEATTQLGDLRLLGNHRLLCGSSRPPPQRCPSSPGEHRPAQRPMAPESGLVSGSSHTLSILDQSRSEMVVSAMWQRFGPTRDFVSGRFLGEFTQRTLARAFWALFGQPCGTTLRSLLIGSARP
jgi:hypothetical protein